MTPNLRKERKLWQRGYRRIVGVDEVGRGPLAGPVVACAVSINKKVKPLFKIGSIRDSKRLSEKQREELYRILTNHPGIEWGTGRVSERVIDRINILEATKLAMARAVRKIRQPSFLILDGKITLNLRTSQESIVKADEKVLSCACASIIAKVTRDRLMKNYHKKYGLYGFDKHKGYPTKLHRKMLKKYGPSEIHRKTFKLT